MDGKTFHVESPDETRAIAARIAERSEEGCFIALRGELGTGKTVFVKGLAEGLNVADSRYVTSPTYMLLKEYEGKLKLYHFDLYRTNEGGFAETVDYRKYFYSGQIVAVEWAGRIESLLPETRLEVLLEYGARPNERLIHVDARSSGNVSHREGE